MNSKFRVNDTIKEIVSKISEEESNLQEVVENANTLGIINKVQYNRLMNVYINNTLASLNSLQAFNNRMFGKVSSKSFPMSSKDFIKVFLDLKKLETDQLKVLNELSKTQQMTLNQLEREIVIIFRSIPTELQQLLYTTILGFVAQCPEIQKAMMETNQKLRDQLGDEAVEKEIEKQNQKS